MRESFASAVAGAALASAVLAQSQRPDAPETWGTATGYTTVPAFVSTSTLALNLPAAS